MQAKLKDYIDIIQKVARVEYKRIPAHMLDCEELVSIGIIALQALFKDKTDEQMQNYNSSYIATAVRWAIRNELRNRYKWYGVRQQKNFLTEDERSELHNAIYKTVLSTDELCDGEHNFEIKDSRQNPEENCEFYMLSGSIRNAITTLPQRERDLIESKFFKDKKLHELSDEFSISPSRISRIIKQSLDRLKDELVKEEVI